MVKLISRATAFLVILTLFASISYLLGTNKGGRLLTRIYLDEYIGFEDIVIQNASGSLLSGLTLRQVELKEPSELPAGSVVFIESVHFKPILLGGEKWLKFRMNNVRWQSPYSKEEITFKAVTGSPFGGLRWHRLSASGVHGFPTGSTVRVGNIHSFFAFNLESLVKVQAGELLLPRSRFCLFSAHRPRAGLKAKVTCERLDPRDTPALFPRSLIQSKVPSMIERLSIFVDRFEEKSQLIGRVGFEKFTHSDFQLKDFKAVFRVKPILHGGEFRFQGEMILKDVVVLWRNRVIQLETGRIYLKGSPEEDILDIYGSTVVDGVRIEIHLTGTSDQPHIQISSHAGISQKRLFFMFAVGKQLKNILLMPLVPAQQ